MKKFIASLISIIIGIGYFCVFKYSYELTGIIHPFVWLTVICYIIPIGTNAILGSFVLDELDSSKEDHVEAVVTTFLPLLNIIQSIILLLAIFFYFIPKNLIQFMSNYKFK